MTEPNFDALYAAHHAKVLAHAVRLVGYTDAPDVAQQVWTKVFQRLETFRGDAAVATWLYVVTRNAAADHHKLRSRRGWTHEVPVDAAAHVPIDLPTPEEVAIRANQLTCMARAIDHLSPDYQAALLSTLTGDSTPVRAAMFGIPVGTMKTRTWRAFQAVSQLYALKPFARKFADSARAS